MPSTLKEFIKLYAPLAIAILVVAAWFLESRNHNHLELEAERQNTTVALGANIITRTLSNHASDAQFLARLVARGLEEDQHDKLRSIEDAFIDFARSRNFYFILRYIDENGIESIRVDRSFAGPVISPPSALQDKSSRYYVKQTLKAGKNDVYISEFDLNIEHGRVEIPFRPTLRFGCPVIDNLGRKRGMVVLNLDGANLLNQIRIQAETGDGVTLLCNGEGYWMLGPSAQEEWGNIVKTAKNASMPNRFPDAWAIMSRTDRAQMETGNGLFSFDTVGLIPDAVMSEVPPSVEDAKKRWKILTWVPSEKLSVPWMPLYIVLLGVFLCALAMGCWHLADYRIRQSEVEAKLRENEERTLAISQSSQDAITMIDSQDRITHWNPAAEKLFGYTQNEAMGKKLHELMVPKAMQGRAQEGMLQFAQTGHGAAVDNVHEFEAIRKDGQLVPVEIAISSFQLKGEWYAVGSMRDMTRRKRVESQLRESEATSRALINAPTDSAFLIEPNGTILAANKIGAQRLGHTVDDLMTMNIFSVLPRTCPRTGAMSSRLWLQPASSFDSKTLGVAVDISTICIQ